MVQYNKTSLSILTSIAWVVILVGAIISLVDLPTPFQTVCYPESCKCTAYYKNDMNGTCIRYDVDLIYREKENKEEFAVGHLKDSYVCPHESMACWVKDESPPEIYLVPTASTLAVVAQVMYTLGAAMLWPSIIIGCVFTKDS